MGPRQALSALILTAISSLLAHPSARAEVAADSIESDELRELVQAVDSGLVVLPAMLEPGEKENCPGDSSKARRPRLSHALTSSSQENHFVGSVLLHLPIVLGSTLSKHSIDWVSAANNQQWYPKVTLQGVNGGVESLPPVQSGSCDSCASTPSVLPDRIEIEADGIQQAFDLRYDYSPGTDTQIGLSLNGYVLLKKPLPTHFLAGDDFIERFHCWNGRCDTFGRIEFNAMNQAHESVTDAKGRTYTVHDGQLFVGNLQLNGLKRINFFKGDRLLFSVTVGGSIGLPLNRLNPYVSAGASIASQTTMRLTDKQSVTATVGGSVADNQLARVNSGTDIMDQSITTRYLFAAAWKRETARGELSVGTELSGTSGTLKPGNWRNVTDNGTYQKGDQKQHQLVWDRTLNSYRAEGSLKQGNERATIQIAYTLKKSDLTVGIYFDDDLGLFKKSERIQDSPFSSGTNASDDQFGIRFRKGFGKRKK